MEDSKAIEILKRIMLHYTEDERDAIGVAIEALRERKYIDEMIDNIDGTDWYSLNKIGELVHGAKGNGDALYKAEDILEICNRYRSEDE